MAKYYGKIGFAETVESSPGVWSDVITEREYCGDVLSNRKMYQPSDSINDNINISNQISIISDTYACQNCPFMRYITYMGSKWKIKSVEAQYPRLILTMGDVYTEQ